MFCNIDSSYIEMDSTRRLNKPGSTTRCFFLDDNVIYDMTEKANIIN